MIDFSGQFFRSMEENFPSVAVPELSLPQLPGASSALAAAWLAKRSPSKLCLCVVESQPELERVHSDSCALAKFSGATPELFPQEMPGEPETTASRMRVVRGLQCTAEDAPVRVIVASLPALLQSVPAPGSVDAASVFLKKGGAYAFDEVVEKLANAGYNRVPEVDSPAQFAVRGGILDVWAPDSELPCRAEFFDVELESLRLFDPVTQLSAQKAESIWLPPCGKDTAPAEVCLAELLPQGTAILWLDHDRIRSGVLHKSDWEKLFSRVKSSKPQLQVFAGEPAPSGVPSFPLPIASFPGLAELGADVASHPELLVKARENLFASFVEKASHGENVFLCADTPGTAEMLNREISSRLTGGKKSVRIQRLALSGGFILPGLTVACQPDLYAVRRKTFQRQAVSSVRTSSRVEKASDLEPGDYVVHVEHGIGRFLGTTEIVVDGERTEVFTVEYAEGAKLHVPVRQTHLLGKYIGVSGRRVKLHKLGGTRWDKEKAGAERSVRNLAASLLETQAKRMLVQGVSFNPEPPWMAEFEAAFPHQETPDQERGIDEIKRDMASSRPMDRLVCGDAGYGKTELAMRAAFLAVMNGWQVAVLVPTTVLAEQHCETFRDRMAAFPVRIEVMDRLHGEAHKLKVLQGAASGAVDIVIGTHSLLGDDVSFKRLGLLIVDEEQRFGVAHKEKLKAARQVLDVLTLSATPIPRTLYMSMTGARDMTLLQTPPRERVPVETKIARDTDQAIVSAINGELAHGGQVYFLYNRVLTIELMRNRLQRLLPDVRIACAHGQMQPKELSRIMQEFQSGEIDVLLSTSIVENGLDIPRANTIIVHRADRFGIADLYQLRGRVGRSSQKGHALFLLPESGRLDSEARDRIDAIKRNGGLGAGFNLALRDLEMRGAGNLLGREQSGEIAAVGFGLYCQLLKRTIAQMKGEPPPLLVDVAVQLDFLDYSPGSIHAASSACVPYNYIEEEGSRMMFHRRLAEMTSPAEVKALRRELADRWGQPPAPVVRLLKLAEIRIAAAKKGLSRVEVRDGRLQLWRKHEELPLFASSKLSHVAGKTSEQKLENILKVISGT